jgi:hypothetical protein
MQEETNNYMAREDILQSAIYERYPALLNPLRQSLQELQSMARTYSVSQKYDLTAECLNSLTVLIMRYLNLRDGNLQMSNSMTAMLGLAGMNFDALLTQQMEELLALHRSAISKGDVQLSQQVISTLGTIGEYSVDKRAANAPAGENPITAFIVGYIIGPVETGALRGLDDVSMSGSRALASIAKKLVARQLYLTAQTTVDNVQKLARIGIVQRKAHVSGEAVKGIAEVLATAVANAIVGSHTIKHCFDALSALAIAEVGFPQAPNDHLSLKYAIGSFLDIGESTAIPNLLKMAINLMVSGEKERDFRKASKYRMVIEELTSDFWRDMAEIGAAAAKTESFALYYVNANIGEIARDVLWLIKHLRREQIEPVDETTAQEAWERELFSKELLKELDWLIGSTYWRIFDALPAAVKTHLVWDFFSTLSDIGIRALEIEIDSIADTAIQQLASLATKSIDKPIEANIFAPADIAVYIARIGITALKNEKEATAKKAVTTIVEFNKRYIGRMLKDRQEFPDRISEGLDDMKRQLQRNQWMFDPEDIYFYRKISVADVDNFASLIDKAMKGRGQNRGDE